MKTAAIIARWQKRLRLGDWTIRIAKGMEPDEGDRSTVVMHSNVRQAVIRLRSDTPESQVERQIVHEMLHIRLIGAERAFIEAKVWTPKASDDPLDAMWHLGQEAAIEALCDALGCEPRADWTDEVFAAAYPPRTIT